MGLNLTEALAVVAVKQKLPFTTYKTLGQWLGCYNFIPRSERELSSILLTRMMHDAKLNVLGPKHIANDVFQVWLLADMMEVTLTVGEQTKVAIWMNGLRR